MSPEPRVERRPRTQYLRLDVTELGPRGRALVDRVRRSREEVAVTWGGRTVARLVPADDDDAEERVIWDVEAVAP